MEQRKRAWFNHFDFLDHREYHKQILSFAIVSAVLAALFYLLIWMANGYLRGLYDLSGLVNRSSIMLFVGWSVVIAIWSILAAMPKRGQWFKVGMLTLISTMIAIGTATFMTYHSPGYPWLTLFIVGLPLGIVAGHRFRDYRRFALPIAMSLSLMLATWIHQEFILSLFSSQPLPELLALTLQGAIFGSILATALVLRQIAFKVDVVDQHYQEMKSKLKGEIAELALRGMKSYRESKEVLTAHLASGHEFEPRVEKKLEELMTQILDISLRWTEVEDRSRQNDVAKMSERICQIDEKIESTTDTIAQKQYQLAKESLVRQLEYLGQIDTNRQRLISKMHCYLSSLEALHLTIVNHRGMDTLKFSDELALVLDELSDAGVAIDSEVQIERELSEVMS